MHQAVVLFRADGTQSSYYISFWLSPVFMEDLLLLQFMSIVNMIYGDVSYLQPGSSIFP